MPGKKKSGKGASARSRSSKKSAKSRSSGKSRATSAASEQRIPDIMDAIAMENLYYIAHGAVDALEMRGFGWTGASKKKGKKGKKKK